MQATVHYEEPGMVVNGTKYGLLFCAEVYRLALAGCPHKFHMVASLARIPEEDCRVIVSKMMKNETN